MTLVLHAHPLSSYCHKVLIALDELAVPFELAFLNLGDEAQRRAFHALWPVGKMPVLEDKTSGLVLPEASIIIEWLNTRAGGWLVPQDLRQRSRFGCGTASLTCMSIRRCRPSRRTCCARLADAILSPSRRRHRNWQSPTICWTSG